MASKRPVPLSAETVAATTVPTRLPDSLRGVSDVLRALVDVDRDWAAEDTVEVATAVAEHLLVLASVLPSDVPWLAGWQRLARRYGAIAAPVDDAPTGGLGALTDLRVRLEQVADRAEQGADRERRTG